MTDEMQRLLDVLRGMRDSTGHVCTTFAAVQEKLGSEAAKQNIHGTMLALVDEGYIPPAPASYFESGGLGGGRFDGRVG